MAQPARSAQYFIATATFSSHPYPSQAVLRQSATKLIPQDGAKRIRAAGNNAYIAITQATATGPKTLLVNEFSSSTDIVNAGRASCYIPLWSGDTITTK